MYQFGQLAPNLASGDSSHAEGVGTIASGFAAHAEGGVSFITGTYLGPVASGDFSHAEGEISIASGYASHAEGKLTTASGSFSHAEGYFTTASGGISHAEGLNTTASGDYGSHAEGEGTTASGFRSHAEGFFTIASGLQSHAEGAFTNTAGFNAAHIMGRYGNAEEDYSWFIGNGTSDVLRGLGAKWLASDGEMYIDGTTYNTGGADVAEMFETIDGNSIDFGYFVTLEEDKIRIATSADDFILGISSATPSLLGNSAGLSWHGRYVLDEWGRRTYHEVTIP